MDPGLKNLILKCLDKDPEKRATLQQIMVYFSLFSNVLNKINSKMHGLRKEELNRVKINLRERSMLVTRILIGLSIRLSLEREFG